MAGLTLSTPARYTARATVFASIPGVINDPAYIHIADTYLINRMKSYALIVDSDAILRPVSQRLSLNASPRQLAGQVKAEVPLNSVVMYVQATDRRANTARSIANAVADQLVATAQQLESTTAVPPTPARLVVVSPATRPSSPSTPRPRRWLPEGAVVGLIAAIVGTYAGEAAAVRWRRPPTVKEA